MGFWLGLALFIGGGTLGAIAVGLLSAGKCNECREWRSAIKLSPVEVVGLMGPLVAAAGEDDLEQSRRQT